MHGILLIFRFPCNFVTLCAQKQEAADAMRLQFREESAMLLLSFEQQTQALQLQLQQTEEQLAALRQSAQQRPGALVSSSSSSASFARSAGTMSLPQTPQRSRTPSLRVNSRPQLQQNSGHSRNGSHSQRGAEDGSDFDDSERGSFASPTSYHSTASTAATDDAASLHAGLNLLSSSAGDLRARSVLMAADRRATLSSLEAFGAALVLHSGSAASPAADSGSASGHGAGSSSGGQSHVRSGVQNAVGNAKRRGTVPLLPDEVDDSQLRNGLGVDEADLQFRLAPWPSAFVAVAATDLRREPVMQYDDSGDACTLCAVQFGLLTRRHHCRAWYVVDLRICPLCVFISRNSSPHNRCILVLPYSLFRPFNFCLHVRDPVQRLSILFLLLGQVVHRIVARRQGGASSMRHLRSQHSLCDQGRHLEVRA